jgi:hypothetical protein
VLAGWGADDGENLVDAGVEEAFAENALADHAGGSEEDYVHLVMLQRGRRRAELARRHGSESVSEPTLEAVGKIVISHNVRCSGFIGLSHA